MSRFAWFFVIDTALSTTVLDGMRMMMMMMMKRKTNVNMMRVMVMMTVVMMVVLTVDYCKYKHYHQPHHHQYHHRHGNMHVTHTHTHLPTYLPRKALRPKQKCETKGPTRKQHPKNAKHCPSLPKQTEKSIAKARSRNSRRSRWRASTCWRASTSSGRKRWPFLSSSVV